jgi:competence protein ComEC
MAPGRSLKLLAGVLLAAILLRPATGTTPGAFELSVLDVGHGLATVVRTENRVIVFDTGPGWRGGGSAARVTVTPFLRSLGVRTIDLVVVSHADADHAGGLEELRRTFDVRRVIGDLQLRQGSADGPCVAGQSWKWDGVGFSVLHPRGGEAYGDNDRSCALAIRGPGGSALLLADPEGRAERAMLDAGGLSADVVLVPHHGSATSSSAGLVAAVGARLALVSTDFGNRWGLPRPEVVARWQDGGAQVLSTAGSGALGVTVSPAGGVGPVTAHRRSEPRWWRRRE